MNSFILVYKNITQQEEYLKQFIADHTISPFDVTTIAEEGNIGIEIVRKIQETLFLKPYKGQEKIIVIQNAQNLTVEAQNALLKLLEEPPEHTFIFLCSTTDDIFLPTILSRCKIVTLLAEKDTKSEVDKEVLAEQLSILNSGIVGKKLALSETLATDKENLEKWFEEMVHFVREEMLKNIDEIESRAQYARILQILQEGYKSFSTTNVSPRTILEHCFLQL